MSTSQYFHHTLAPQADVIAIVVGTDVDIEAFNEINDRLIEQWPVEAGRNVVVDLTASRFSGSVLLGLIVNIRQRTRASGGELVVVGASPRLTQVLRTANLDRLIPLAATREQAMERW